MLVDIWLPRFARKTTGLCSYRAKRRNAENNGVFAASEAQRRPSAVAVCRQAMAQPDKSWRKSQARNLSAPAAGF
jgi:hypothetical protein